MNSSHKTILFILFVFFSLIFITNDVFAKEPINHYSEENIGCLEFQTPTMSVISLNVTDGVDFDFIQNEKYLILVTTDFGGADISHEYGVEVKHNTTTFEGSQHIFEPDEANDNACDLDKEHELYTYLWFTVWNPTTVDEASHDIIVNHTNQQTSKGYHENTSMLIIHLNNTQLVENTDWFFSENTTDTTLTTAFGGSGNATLSFTPPNNNTDWLILGTSQMDTGDATVQYETRMFVNGTDCTFCDKPVISFEGEDPTTELYVQSFARAINLKNEPQVIQTQTRTDAVAGGTNERLFSSIFALNIDRLEANVFNYTDPEQDVGDVEHGTLVFSETINPVTNNTSLVIISDVGVKDTDINNSLQFRVQVNDTDVFGNQTLNANAYEGENSPDDILRFHRMAVENVTNSTQIIDVDVSNLETTFDSETIHSSIIAFNLILNITDFIATPEPDDPMSMVDDIRLDLVKNFTDPMSMVDDIRLDLVKNFTDPMSMVDDIRLDLVKNFTDPMSMVDQIETMLMKNFTDPMSMVDDIRLDLVKNFTDPMSMVDDIRLDLVKNFTDPMSMVDQIETMLMKNFTDPMSMVDDIRLDLVKNFTDPMSMVDDIRLDLVKNFTDPMSFTDFINATITVFKDDPMSMIDDIRFDFVSTPVDPMSFTDTISTFQTFGQIVVPPPPVTVTGGQGGGVAGASAPTVPDSDRDGLLDDIDQCPLEPETFNNFEDEDGCPDVFGQPEPITIADLGFPFMFNELSVINDFINLETDSPQPQVEDLGIRWLGDEPVTITKIDVGSSPFEVQFEDLPVSFGNNQFGFTQEQVIYTVQEPAKICTTSFSFDCVDELTYEIPVLVTGEVRGKTVIAEGSLTIDNTNRFNPYWLVLLFLIGIPLFAFFLWRRRRKEKPKTKTLLKVTQARPTGKVEVTRAKPLKAGTTKKILTEAEKTNILGKKTG